MLVTFLLMLTRQGWFYSQSSSFRTLLAADAFAEWDLVRSLVQSRDLTTRMERGRSCCVQKPLWGVQLLCREAVGVRGAFSGQLYQIGERCYPSEEARDVRDVGLSRSKAGPEDSGARGLCASGGCRVCLPVSWPCGAAVAPGHSRCRLLGT